MAGGITRRMFGAAAVAAALAMSAVTTAAPEPDAVPRRWQFNIEPGDLRVATVLVDGVGPRTYFYMTYLVTNNTGQDRFFAPSFELYTDDGTIVRSGRDVAAEVTDAIRGRLADPDLLDQIQIQSMLLQGPANAREGIVVWPAANLKVNEVVVFAEGLSGETKTVARPDNGEQVILRKTLMLRHQTVGEIDPSSNAPLHRTVQRWILR